MKGALIITVIYAIAAVAFGSDLCNDENEGTFLANPDESCAAYFYCSAGTAIPGECPYPFYFNFPLQICDFPQNVNCQSSPTTPEITTEGATEEITTTEEETTTEETTVVVTEEPSVCANVINGVFVGNPDDCGAFFICVDEQAFPSTCPAGLLFNGQYCDLAERVQCDNGETTTHEPITTTATEEITATCTQVPETPTDEPNTEIVCIPGEVSFHAHPESCSLYILCFGGNSIELSCPADNHWQQSTESCIPISESTCQD